MAISIVGTTFTQTSGASSATVTPDAGIATGDVVFLWLVAFSQTGATFTTTPPTGGDYPLMTSYRGESTSYTYTYRLYCVNVTGAPPSSFDFTFSRSDIYADVSCVVVRGHKSITGSPFFAESISPCPVVEAGRIDQSSSGFPSNVLTPDYNQVVRFGDIVTSTDGCLMLVFVEAENAFNASSLSFSMVGGLSNLWSRQRTWTQFSQAE